MRNIRILVEFASTVMPGAVLLIALTLLYAPAEWIEAGSYNSLSGIATGVALSFTLGHLLQGIAQVTIEPIWRRMQAGGPAAWTVGRFAGREAERFLTDEQIAQLDVQFPAKLGVPFPPASDAARRFALDCAVSHAEAFLQAAKVAESLEDVVTDLRLNKGLLTALLVIAIAVPPAATGAVWLALPASLAAAAAAYFRMDLLNRKYIQGLFLLFLTATVSREGGGRGNGGGAGAGGGGGVIPIGMGRGGSRGGFLDDEGR